MLGELDRENGGLVVVDDVGLVRFRTDMGNFVLPDDGGCRSGVGAGRCCCGAREAWGFLVSADDLGFIPAISL